MVINVSNACTSLGVVLTYVAFTSGHLPSKPSAQKVFSLDSFGGKDFDNNLVFRDNQNNDLDGDIKNTRYNDPNSNSKYDIQITNKNAIDRNEYKTVKNDLRSDANKLAPTDSNGNNDSFAEGKNNSVVSLSTAEAILMNEDFDNSGGNRFVFRIIFSVEL